MERGNGPDAIGNEVDAIGYISGKAGISLVLKYGKLLKLGDKEGTISGLAFFLSDMKVKSGMSGGPVLNRIGEVVGMVNLYGDDSGNCALMLNLSRILELYKPDSIFKYLKRNKYEIRRRDYRAEYELMSSLVGRSNILDAMMLSHFDLPDQNLYLDLFEAAAMKGGLLNQALLNGLDKLENKPEVIKLLKNLLPIYFDDVGISIGIMRRLKDLGHEDILRENLSNKRAHIRKFILCNWLATNRPTEEIVGFLNDSDPEIQREAARILMGRAAFADSRFNQYRAKYSEIVSGNNTLRSIAPYVKVVAHGADGSTRISLPINPKAAANNPRQAKR